MPLYSREVPNTSTSDRGNIRRSIDPLAHPQLGAKGCRTLYETFRRGEALNPLGPCLGFRAVSTNGEATPYIFLSYTECMARVNCLAAGLGTLGLLQPNQDGLKLLGLYMKNCMEWILAEHATYAVGGATVPFYDTLGPETVQYILTQTEMTALVCTRAELRAVCEAKKSGQCPRFRTAILLDGVIPEASSMAHEAGIEVVSFAKVEGIGAQVIAKSGGTYKHTPPSGKDICTFCYTSGTTGDPKGAMLTHENMVSAMAGMDGIFEPLMTDRHLSYLPLAHIFERIIMSQMLMAGASVGFFRGNPLWLIEDIQALQPTLIPVAPRVLNKIHDKIQAGMQAAGGLKLTLFQAALHAKTEGLRNHGHLTHGLYDRLIFNKIKKALGMDQVRFMVSGSAPLSESVMTFFRCLLGVPVVEGYGQTEGAAAATVSALEDQSTVGHVGAPTGCCEVVLVNVPEMGYTHRDTHHNGIPCEGRGEIWVRGPNVFVGYYKDDQKTKETVDEDGWLHSGDIGLWTTEGNLQIIDRKKNIFKLAQGEYVAPEKIENILIRSSLVGQSFVHGDSLQTCLVSVIVPDEEPVRAWAASVGGDLSKLSMGELCQNPLLKNAIMNDIQRLSEENGLHGFETPKAVHLEPELFTPENDLVTPTFKLKRNKLRDHYEKEIADMYASVPPPPSKL
eukprot:CAMPEP_0195281536 /NCGR_PEP_ID=MMETSP0707-20130614/807_1 /TAXON_ID=33640 /ORGANISM="Asterionellopsis glacialis, Strain CCMP134" /LENGTH=675 /DNA_ID=CAMNT_0040340435 /DNA_START=73 /DNA_END=2100 /DNA_ORIENTATION=-